MAAEPDGTYEVEMLIQPSYENFLLSWLSLKVVHGWHFTVKFDSYSVCMAGSLPLV